jgi:hypothetical protein
MLVWIPRLFNNDILPRHTIYRPKTGTVTNSLWVMIWLCVVVPYFRWLTVQERLGKTTKAHWGHQWLLQSTARSVVFCCINWSDGLDDLGFKSQYGQEIFLLSKSSRQALEKTQPPTQWVPGLFYGYKRREREVGHSTPSSAFMTWTGIHLPCTFTKLSEALYFWKRCALCNTHRGGGKDLICFWMKSKTRWTFQKAAADANAYTLLNHEVREDNKPDDWRTGVWFRASTYKWNI